MVTDIGAISLVACNNKTYILQFWRSEVWNMVYGDKNQDISRAPFWRL